jgi:hypothetical protein
MNEHSYNVCEKKRFKYYSHACEQAFNDEFAYEGKRKVYYCWDCASWHTSTERVKINVPLLER